MSEERDYGGEQRALDSLTEITDAEVRCYFAQSLATTSCLGCGAHILLDGNNCKHCGAPPRTFKLFTGDE